MTTVAQVRPEGLLVNLDDGILLNCECHKVGSEFLISCASALLLARRTGQTVCDGDGNISDGLALILRDSSTLFTQTSNDAVLVEIQETYEGIFFSGLRAIYSVGLALQDQPGVAQIISGRSVNKQQWCVG